MACAEPSMIATLLEEEDLGGAAISADGADVRPQKHRRVRGGDVDGAVPGPASQQEPVLAMHSNKAGLGESPEKCW
jgi:hypothetical protein